MEKEVEYLIFFFFFPCFFIFVFPLGILCIYIVSLNKSMRRRLISTISFPPSDVQIFYIWLVIFRFYSENLIFMYIQ